jgi:fatty acid desaturase
MNTLIKPPAPAYSMLNTLANGLLFNISWLAIVSTHSLVLAPLVVVLHLLVHFTFMGRGMVEARLVFGVTLVGFLLDQILFAFGIFTLSGEYSFAPLWISCLWPVLATTLMHAFSRLQQRLTLATLVGALGGAASYEAGTRLSDVDFASPFWGPIIMASTWAIVFPSLLLAARINVIKVAKNNDA